MGDCTCSCEAAPRCRSRDGRHVSFACWPAYDPPCGRWPLRGTYCFMSAQLRSVSNRTERKVGECADLAAPTVSTGGSLSLRVQWIADDEFINRPLNDGRQRGGCGLIFTRRGGRRTSGRECCQAPTLTLPTGESSNCAFVA